MKDVYKKLIIERHINNTERSVINYSIDGKLLAEYMKEMLLSKKSIPNGYQFEDDSIELSGHIIFMESSNAFIIKEFQEVSYLCYIKTKEYFFKDIDEAVKRYITLEFKGNIDGIPII